MAGSTFTTLSFLNTSLLNGNETTTPGVPTKPRTPPPIGYYGDVRVQLWKILPPILMTWGIIGNSLTIIILIRMARRASVTSTTLYITALAISDTIILLCGPLRNWIIVNWEKDVRYYSDASCKSQLYFTYFSIHFSSWILVAITLERVISVVLPHKVKFGCTPRNALVIIFSIMFVIGGMSLVHPIIQGLEGNVQSLKCLPTSAKYTRFRDDVYIWIDFFLSFSLPFVILLIGNIVIIVKLNKSRKVQETMNVSRGDGKSAGRDTKSLSVLLISLSVIFLLTMTPVNIFAIYSPYRFEIILGIEDPYEQWYAYQYILYQQAIVNIVGYTNACFNFILYVFTGSKFRTELKNLFKCSLLRMKVSAASNMIRSNKTSQTHTKSSKSLIQDAHTLNTNSSNITTTHESGHDQKDIWTSAILIKRKGMIWKSVIRFMTTGNFEESVKSIKNRMMSLMAVDVPLLMDQIQIMIKNDVHHEAHHVESNTTQF